jgi:hypothetical protein
MSVSTVVVALNAQTFRRVDLRPETPNIGEVAFGRAPQESKTPPSDLGDRLPLS